MKGRQSTSCLYSSIFGDGPRSCCISIWPCGGRRGCPCAAATTILQVTRYLMSRGFWSLDCNAFFSHLANWWMAVRKKRVKMYNALKIGLFSPPVEHCFSHYPETSRCLWLRNFIICHVTSKMEFFCYAGQLRLQLVHTKLGNRWVVTRCDFRPA